MGKKKVDYEKLMSMYADGVRVEEIAAAVGCSKTWVYKVIKKERGKDNMIEFKNAEGYADPTAYGAMTEIHDGEAWHTTDKSGRERLSLVIRDFPGYALAVELQEDDRYCAAENRGVIVREGVFYYDGARLYQVKHKDFEGFAFALSDGEITRVKGQINAIIWGDTPAAKETPEETPEETPKAADDGRKAEAAYKAVETAYKAVEYLKKLNDRYLDIIEKAVTR